ncbi:MAG: tRNA epoxyqueuosine(34) reductase QueG [Pseudomonadota bacterium]
MTPESAKSQLIKDLKKEGFDQVGVVTAKGSTYWEERLHQFIGAGFHGTMSWMSDTFARRIDPQILWPEAKTAIVSAMTYGPGEYDPLAALKRKSQGTISCYAHNRDYHDVIKGKLKQAAGRFAAKTAADVKVFVDTAPLMEKPLAQAAGLGWQGKHTNLVSRDLGSWFFLSVILTDMQLPVDQAQTDHCGQCSACLDICPTDAFPRPYQLDARRCISYLTIEHDGSIDRELRAKMGNRIYGCDDCLAVCPWNKFAVNARDLKLQARDDMKSPPLSELLGLDDKAFRQRFSGSPIKRIGRDRFVRNCLVAAGNSGDKSLVPLIKQRLADDAEQVRAMAVWALRQVGDAPDVINCRREAISREASASVLREWN